MSKLTDRASYLKGLAEGMRLNPEKDANRLLLQVIELLGEAAGELEELSGQTSEIDALVETLEDDLYDLEDVLFEDEGELPPPSFDPEDDDYEEFDDEEITYVCPHCGHEMTFLASEIDFADDTRCPACGKPAFPELSDEDEEQEQAEAEENETDADAEDAGTEDEASSGNEETPF